MGSVVAFTDAFGRSSTDDLGSNWTALQGTLTGWGANGTQGTRSAASGSRHSVYASGAGSFTDALTEVKCVSNFGTCGVIARRTGNSYYLVYNNGSSSPSTGTFIFYYDGSSYTNLGSSAGVTISNGDVLGLHCSGTTLTVYKNGSATALSASHSTLTSGESGLFQDSGAASTWTFDDFQVTDLIAFTKTYTADGVVLPNTGKTYTADGLVQATNTKSYTSDAIVREVIADGFSDGYAYRQTAPVANPSTLGDRTFTMRFPGEFLYAQGKITSATFDDVRVVDASTGWVLPHSYTSNVLTVDFAGMPVGRRYLYVYYGKSGGAAPTAPSLGASSTVQVIDPNGEVTSADDTSPTDYIFGSDLDCTYIDSGAATTYYGAGTSHKLGVTTSGRKYHLLLKPGEWCLRKGTTSSAKLHLYVETNNVGSGETLSVRTHRFKNYGVDDANGTNRHEYWVKTGWTLQTDGAPTWNSRYINYNRDSSGATLTAWQTAGATGSNEIDSSEYVNLGLTGASGTGYKSIDLTAAWVDGWQGDSYSSGLLLKDSTDTAGTNDRHVVVTAQGQANTPVMEVTYSDVTGDQLSARKLTSDTFSASTFATQNRYCQIPSTNQFAVMAQVNAELKIDVFYVEPGGRIGRACQNAYNSGRSRFGATSPAFGLHYDAQTGRFWLGGNSDTGSYLQLGYSPAYLPTSFTWVENTSVNSVKSSFFPKNDIVYVVHGNYTNSATFMELRYRTYNRGTATWGGNTQLLTGFAKSTTTTATINSSDVMTGSGTISVSSTTDFPSFGSCIIGTECFWYTGKTSTTLTGVSRGMFGTTAATHSSGGTVYLDRTSPTYLAMSYDAVNDRMCVSYQIVSANLYAYSGYPDMTGTGGALGYVSAGIFFYDFTDARWENGAGTALSLPLNATTEEAITRSNGPAYNLNLTALDDGSVLAGFGEYASPIYTSGDSTTIAAWTEGRAKRLSSGSWTDIDAPDLMETKYTDTAGGRIVVTGVGPLVQSDGSETVYRADSNDYGVTYGSTRAIATHTFAAPSSNANWANNVLWCAGASEQGNLSGKGIAYYQHFAYHGALFLDAIQYPQVITYTADAIVIASQTYTADAYVITRPLQAYTADAIVNEPVATTRTTTYTADAILLAVSTRAYTADAVVATAVPEPPSPHVDPDPSFRLFFNLGPYL